MQETLFEKYLIESFAKIDEFVGKEMKPQKVMEVFFPNKIATDADDLNICEDRKNAIILVGPSCCGKTTFAREFVEAHPDFVLISMDKCAAEELTQLDDMTMLAMSLGIVDIRTDELGNRSFGQQLEKNNKNIIIDGNWMHVNSRGALLKTLEDLNYHTIICLIFPDNESYSRKVESRVFELIAAEKMNIDLTNLLDGMDVIKAYAQECKVSVEEIKRKMRNMHDFDYRYKDECDLLTAEIRDANFVNQIPNRIIFLGADELLVLRI